VVPPAAVVFLAKGHFPRISYQYPYDKVYNEMIPGTMHRSPGIYLTAEENLS